MVVAIAGPVQEDNIQIAESFQSILDGTKVVDLVQSMRNLNEECEPALARKLTAKLSTIDNFKKLYIKMLENEYETVVLYGNILFNTEVLKYVAEEGGYVVVAQRGDIDDYPEETTDKLKRYFADESAYIFEMTERFSNVYDELVDSGVDENSITLVDLSQDITENDVLMTMLESMEYCEASGSNKEPVQILVEFGNECQEGNMRIEDTIRKAMADLGMNVDDVTDEELPKPPKKQQVKETKKPDKKVEKKPEPVKKAPEPIMNEPEPEEADDGVSVFCKLNISEGTMAVLVPEGVKFTKQTIGGVSFDTFVVPIPDITSSKLQELPVASEEKEEPAKEHSAPKKVPVVKSSSNLNKAKSAPPTAAKRSVNKSAPVGNLDDLQAEKKRLDEEIKQARADGDQEAVLELRKQRRAVRAQINKMREG